MTDTDESQRSDVATEYSSAPGFAVPIALLAVAFAGAAAAGVLESVGAYLVGVSVLVAALCALGRR